MQATKRRSLPREAARERRGSARRARREPTPSLNHRQRHSERASTDSRSRGSNLCRSLRRIPKDRWASGNPRFERSLSSTTRLERLLQLQHQQQLQRRGCTRVASSRRTLPVFPPSSPAIRSSRPSRRCRASSPCDLPRPSICPRRPHHRPHHHRGRRLLLLHLLHRPPHSSRRRRRRLPLLCNTPHNRPCTSHRQRRRRLLLHRRSLP